MPNPVSWFRWYRGKVWHVGFAQDAAACGSERPVDAEAVGERAPANARVCGDCVTASLHLYSLAQSAQMGDPRKTFDPWAPGEALIASEDAETVDDDDPVFCIECPHLIDRHGPLGCREHDDSDPLDGPCPCDFTVG